MPQVRHGLASPGDMAESIALAHQRATERQVPIEALAPPKTANGVRHYQSRIRNYRITLKRGLVRYSADGPPMFEAARSSLGNSFDVRFEMGRFDTSDPELIELLDASARFGPMRDFWDSDRVRIETDRAEIAQIASRVEADPEFAQRLRKVLGKTDHQLPPPTPPTPEAEPEAARRGRKIG